jgi:hypothetical protein
MPPFSCEVVTVVPGTFARSVHVVGDQTMNLGSLTHGTLRGVTLWFVT